jgi:hypothetical protein
MSARCLLYPSVLALAILLDVVSKAVCDAIIPLRAVLIAKKVLIFYLQFLDIGV